MSDMDALDEIQAIFFAECAEGLAVAKEGLSAMAAGDASAEAIGGAFRAVHSIKGGSGALGHAALRAFSQRIENVLDGIRAGRVAPTASTGLILLRALDVLSDHVAAARGRAETPADAAMLAELDALAALAALASAPAEEGADEFGFVPIAAPMADLAFDPEPAAAGQWRVVFGPSRAALANGSEPLLVLRELEDMGGRVVDVAIAGLPALRDLDPEDGYFVWTVELPAGIDEAAIRDCFDFVAPDSRIDIAPLAEADVAMSPRGMAA